MTNAAADETLDLASKEGPYRHRFLMSDGRIVDVLSYRHDTSKIRGIVVDWARGTAKKAGATKEDLERIKIEGSASVELELEVDRQPELELSETPE